MARPKGRRQRPTCRATYDSGVGRYSNVHRCRLPAGHDRPHRSPLWVVEWPRMRAAISWGFE